MPRWRPQPVRSDGPDCFALNCGFIDSCARREDRGWFRSLAAPRFPCSGAAGLASIPGSHRPLGLPGLRVAALGAAAAAAAGNAAWRQRGISPQRLAARFNAAQAELSQNGHPVIESAP